MAEDQIRGTTRAPLRTLPTPLYRLLFSAPIDMVPLTLLTTVLTARDDYAVCDAGMKSLTNEFGAPESRDGSLKIRGLSEEHAFLVWDGLSALRAGEKVELVPSHGDTTLNLHNTYHIVRDGEKIDEWPILAARKYK